jgi:hypothetical protein
LKGLLEQEDYIKRQIDQLGRVLGKLLSDLIGLNSSGQTGNGIEAASRELKIELGLNFEDLASIPADGFIEVLLGNSKLSNDNLDMLANVLFLIAEKIDLREEDIGKVKALYRRSLAIYEYIDRTSFTYSTDRHAKIAHLKNVT